MAFLKALQDHAECMARLSDQAADIEKTAQELACVVRNGNKLLICGNGGSAADAQHFAAELVGRFERERTAWPAIALTTDSSIMTAVGNDYGFEEVFARQVQGLGRRGDVLIGISTSGNSPNVMRAMETARSCGMRSVGLLGRDGGLLKHAVDHAIIVQGASTARIQEAHGFILHFWAMRIELLLTSTV